MARGMVWEFTISVPYGVFELCDGWILRSSYDTARAFDGSGVVAVRVPRIHGVVVNLSFDVLP